MVSRPVAKAEARSDMAPDPPETVCPDDCGLSPTDNCPNSLVSPPPPLPVPNTLSKLFPPTGKVELFICESWNSDGPVGCGVDLRSLSDGRANGFLDPVGWTESGFAMLTWFADGAAVVEEDMGNGEPVGCGNGEPAA